MNRDVFGLIPVLQLGIVMRRLPPRVADALAWPMIRTTVGDIRKVGLAKLPYGPNTQIEFAGASKEWRSEALAATPRSLEQLRAKETGLSAMPDSGRRRPPFWLLRSRFLLFGLRPQRFPKGLDLIDAHCGSGVAPRVANVGRNRRDLRIAELPVERRHRRGCRPLVG